jgi:hypothetical protein
MWIYRSALENREEDQIFLDAAGDSMAREQALLVARIEKLNRPILVLMVLSGLLLVSTGALWAYQSIQSF